MTNNLTPLIYPLVFIAGFVDSIAGGGGIISLTSYMAVGLPAHMALGTNKFSSSVGTTVATIRFARKGHVRWDAAVFSFIGALLGSGIGAQIALRIDERTLSLFVIFFVPFVAVFLFVKKDFGETRKDLSQISMLLLSVLAGFVIGAYDGFFGPGTGTFLIIAFTQLMGLSLMTACGNAKVVNLASNLAAVFTFLQNGAVYLPLAIPCAACGLLGNYLGAGLAMKRGSRIVRPMMIVVVGLLLAKVGIELIGRGGNAL
ncbi:MAG: TSUP family transporter [Clostridia bacterium]|nr:TSUP family transporter [Clostridia bacterium]